MLLRAVVVMAAVASVLGTASPAGAGGLDDCAQRVIRDWYSGGRVDKVYPLPCYRAAIRALPDDVLQYSDASAAIERALENARHRGAPEASRKTDEAHVTATTPRRPRSPRPALPHPPDPRCEAGKPIRPPRGRPRGEDHRTGHPVSADRPRRALGGAARERRRCRPRTSPPLTRDR